MKTLSFDVCKKCVLQWAIFVPSGILGLLGLIHVILLSQLIISSQTTVFFSTLVIFRGDSLSYIGTGVVHLLEEKKRRRENELKL